MFQRYIYKETLKAMNNFGTVIGKGGFGTVFKAQFSDDSSCGEKDGQSFKTSWRRILPGNGTLG
jgi:hypothetical protein